MSLPLVSACAKYVRELYAGSFTLTIQPQGNSHSQDVDQTPIQDADQSPIQDDKQVTIQEAVPVFDTESGEGAAGAPQAGLDAGRGYWRRSRAWRSCALASGGCWAS